MLLHEINLEVPKCPAKRDLFLSDDLLLEAPQLVLVWCVPYWETFKCLIEFFLALFNQALNLPTAYTCLVDLCITLIDHLPFGFHHLPSSFHLGSKLCNLILFLEFNFGVNSDSQSLHQLLG